MWILLTEMKVFTNVKEETLSMVPQISTFYLFGPGLTYFISKNVANKRGNPLVRRKVSSRKTFD
jgi:hypothetical protein